MSTIQVDTPEIMLARLNRSLVALRQVLAPLQNAELDKRLVEVMRGTLVAQLLHQHFVIAVAGVQGAGKTTLVRELLMPPKASQGEDTHDYVYPPGALEWLEPNIGRGEQVPLLILERRDCKEPEARMFLLKEVENRFELPEESLTKGEFQHSLRGLTNNQLCPLLVVPPSVYGGNDAGFILLPGYEPIYETNRAFQEFMRQTLVSAGTAIIVADEARLADNRSMEIMADLRKNFLSGCKPIIAIARTELDSEEKRGDLRSTACKFFEVPHDQHNRVICTGTGDFVEWKSQLHAALNAYHTVGTQARDRQIQYLADILRQAGVLLNDAERAIRIADIPQGENDRTVKVILDTFDSAEKKLRKGYVSTLNKVIDEFRGQAAKAIDDQAKRETGIWYKFKSWAGDLITSDPKKFLEQRDLIESHWRNANGQIFADAHFDLLTNVTAPTYHLSGMLSIAATSDKKALLSYDGLVNEPTAATSGAVTVRRLNPKVESNLTALFTPDRDDVLNLQTNKELKSAVNTLPALALELGRMATLSTGVRNRLQSPETPDLIATAKQMEQDFSNLSKSSSTIIKGLAVILGVDIAADGHIDTIPALWASLTGSGAAEGGAAAASAGATAAGLALVAVIATAVVVNQIKRMESQRYSQGQQIASAFADSYREHCISGFDGIMSHVRDVLISRLEQRYRLDEALTHFDRQTKALGSARSAVNDMQGAIHAAAPSLV